MKPHKSIWFWSSLLFTLHLPIAAYAYVVHGVSTDVTPVIAAAIAAFANMRLDLARIK